MNSSFLECSAPSAASHGWRSILAGREILRQRLSLVVGNDENIKVWEDPWLSLDQPCCPIGPSPSDATTLPVSDLLCRLTNSWNKEMIKRYLPHYEEMI